MIKKKKKKEGESSQLKLAAYAANQFESPRIKAPVIEGANRLREPSIKPN